MNLSDLLKELEAKGVTIKVNEAAEGAENAEQSFELVKFPAAAADTETPDEDGDEEGAQAPALFSQEETDALKALAKSAPALLKDLPAAIAMAQNAATREKVEKDSLIARIKANQANVYTDDELAGMPLSTLTKLDGQMNVNYSGLGGAHGTSQNADAPEFIVLPQPVLLAAPVKES